MAAALAFLEDSWQMFVLRARRGKARLVWEAGVAFAKPSCAKMEREREPPHRESNVLSCASSYFSLANEHLDEKQVGVFFF